MKLANYHKVAALVADRQRLIKDINDAKGDSLGVTIRGTYQDDMMKAAVRNAVVQELKSRLHLVDENLRTLGVEP